MPSKCLVAVGQICSTADMAHNLAQCKTVVEKTVAAGAKVLFLPEGADYLGSSSDETLKLVKSVDDSEFVVGLRAEAKKNKLPISVGIHEPTTDGKKVRNMLVWIDENGEITQRYQKLHMFDADIEDGMTMAESDGVEQGPIVQPPFDTPVGKLGCAICFDLRFPELTLALRRKGAQVIAFPAAFMPDSGVVHWEPLLKARAIETQSWVIAAAQVGWHNDDRESYGHSMIIDPWGEIKAELGRENKGPEIATAEIDVEQVEKLRKEFQMLRRTDIYPEI